MTEFPTLVAGMVITQELLDQIHAWMDSQSIEQFSHMAKCQVSITGRCNCVMTTLNRAPSYPTYFN